MGLYSAEKCKYKQVVRSDGALIPNVRIDDTFRLNRAKVSVRFDPLCESGIDQTVEIVGN